MIYLHCPGCGIDFLETVRLTIAATRICLCGRCAGIYLSDGEGASTKERYRIAFGLARLGFKLSPAFEVVLGEKGRMEVTASLARDKEHARCLEMETLRTQFGGDLDDLLEPRE